MHRQIHDEARGAGCRGRTKARKARASGDMRGSAANGSRARLLALRSAGGVGGRHIAAARARATQAQGCAQPRLGAAPTPAGARGCRKGRDSQAQARRAGALRAAPARDTRACRGERGRGRGGRGVAAAASARAAAAAATAAAATSAAAAAGVCAARVRARPARLRARARLLLPGGPRVPAQSGAPFDPLACPEQLTFGTPRSAIWLCSPSSSHRFLAEPFSAEYASPQPALLLGDGRTAGEFGGLATEAPISPPVLRGADGRWWPAKPTEIATRRARARWRTSCTASRRQVSGRRCRSHADLPSPCMARESHDRRSRAHAHAPRLLHTTAASLPAAMRARRRARAPQRVRRAPGCSPAECSARGAPCGARVHEVCRHTRHFATCTLHALQIELKDMRSGTCTPQIESLSALRLFAWFRVQTGSGRAFPCAGCLGKS